MHLGDIFAVENVGMKSTKDEQVHEINLQRIRDKAQVCFSFTSTLLCPWSLTSWPFPISSVDLSDIVVYIKVKIVRLSEGMIKLYCFWWQFIVRLTYTALYVPLALILIDQMKSQIFF